jgi:hypothetical protein
MKNKEVGGWLDSKNEGIIRWFLMQSIKEASTLRVFPNKEKSSSRIVFRHGK